MLVCLLLLSLSHPARVQLEQQLDASCSAGNDCSARLAKLVRECSGTTDVDTDAGCTIYLTPPFSKFIMVSLRFLILVL